MTVSEFDSQHDMTVAKVDSQPVSEFDSQHDMTVAEVDSQNV